MLKLLGIMGGWLGCLYIWPALGQTITYNTINKVDSAKKIEAYQPEILTNGFIDVINNGQLNASARFIRLYVGEPGKFTIPLSIYSGVSSNSLQGNAAVGNSASLISKNNDQLYNNFINPLSGLANLSIDGISYFK